MAPQPGYSLRYYPRYDVWKLGNDLKFIKFRVRRAMRVVGRSRPNHVCLDQALALARVRVVVQ